MSGDRTYASVPERITWTTGFRVATDKLVLGALSTFANFETGKGARMNLRKLIARAALPRRTVERGLQRLEADGWIVATRRHRHATSWDIAVDRLAKDWIGAKLIGGVTSGFPQGDKHLTATRGGQLPATYGGQLTATHGGQHHDLTATRGGQNTDLTATGGGPIPCTKILTPVEPIPSAPALRAGFFDDADEKSEEGHAPQPETRNPDIRADGADDSDDATRDPRERRIDHQLAPAARVPLRHEPDSPGVEGDHRPRAPVGPTQPGLGLLADVNTPIAATPKPAPQWGQLAAALRKGLERKSG